MENEIYENDLTPATEEQQPADTKQKIVNLANSLLEKAKGLLSNKDVLPEKVKAIPRKIWIIAGAAVVALVAVIVVVSLLGNTYKTPIQAAEKLVNTKSVEKILDRAPTLLNGFGDGEAKKLIKIIKKSDQFGDTLEDAEDAYEELVQNLKDEYGNNYKIKLKIDEKEKLEKEDTKEFRDQLRDVSDFEEQLKDMDPDDYEDMADELGISKSQAKDMVKQLRSFCKMCKTAKVTAGYELSVIVSITGSELEEPEEQDMTVRVFKVDGRWVPDVFSLVESIGILGLGSLMGGF